MFLIYWSTCNDPFIYKYVGKVDKPISSTYALQFIDAYNQF